MDIQINIDNKPAHLHMLRFRVKQAVLRFVEWFDWHSGASEKPSLGS